VGSDASGFDPSTVSTAADMSTIGLLLLDDPVLAKIVSTERIEIFGEGWQNNTNPLLATNETVIGIKTGNTVQAGSCLTVGVQYLGLKISIVIMGSPNGSQTATDAQTLVNSVQTQLRPRNIIEAGAEIGYYETWWAGRIPIYAVATRTAPNWQSGIEMSANSPPLEFGAVNAGNLVFTTPQQSYETQLVINAPVTEPTIWQRLVYSFVG
jgi:D-alanyl-D-alanine carboxypeptidase (penicillin-binding protein 5/6)